MPLPKKDKPLTKQLSVRVTPEIYERVKMVPNHQDKLRALIQQWLENLEQEQE
ncbi:hypothetical protein NIES4071_96590 [Calothrix sp. NIES-4071]|nr:hypothetical protein NIES4071_96590 [Calothrix sp. NIES-4071]BAZ63924.1 hypothetical protein NIES4105_96520 [Calothrix sp. NIES-4105]